MDSSLHDDRLRLLFTCCHPALPLEARVALTLKALGGLTHRRGGPRVPRLRGGDAPAARRARGARSPTRASPTACPPRRAAARAPGRGPGGRLPRVQRGPHGGRRRAAGPRGAVRGGAAARAAARRPDARRGGGARAAGADAAHRRAARGAARRARPGGRARRPGPRRAGTRRRSREGAALLDRALRLRPARALPAPGRDRRAARDRRELGGDRLGADRRALRGAGRARPVARGGGQPRGGRRLRRRPAARAWRCCARSTATRRSAATPRCTPPAPSCCAGPATGRAPTPPTRARSRRRPTRCSAPSSRPAAPRSAGAETT